MEHKDRLDEFLQRKFAEDDPENRFAFREADWLEAQARLEAAERRRRWLWWWWGALGLGAGFLIWQLAGPGTQPHPAARIVTPPQAPASTGMANGDTAAQTLQESRTITPATPESAMASNFSATVQTPATANPGAIATQRGHSQNQSHPIRTTAKSPALPVAAEPSITPVSLRVPASIKAPQTNNPPAMPWPQSIPAYAPTRPEGVLTPDLLPTCLSILPAPAPRLPARSGTTAPPVAEIGKHRDWEFHAGLAVAGATPCGALRDEKPGIAGGLSVRAQRKGSPWSFEAEMLWRLRRGWAIAKTPALEEATQLQYSFGYVHDVVQLPMTGAQWLELPLSTQYHWRSFAGELGAAPSLLLFAQGVETRIRSTSLAPDAHTTRRVVRLPNRYFLPAGLGLFAGLQWSVNGRLGLGLRLQYQPATFLQTPVDHPANPKKPLWLDLRARYFLFDANK